MNDTDRRADALRVIADRWDEMHTGLTAGQGLTEDEATDALIALSRGFAHPDLDAESVHEWMIELRNACHRLSQYELGWLAPEDVAENWRPDDETCLSLLNHDVDGALFPLLIGSTTAHVCPDCRRTLSDVRLWNKSVEGCCGRCEYHYHLFAEQIAHGKRLAAAR